MGRNQTLNRDTFLADGNVREFIVWAGHLISGEWRLKLGSGDGTFASCESVSLYDAYKKYKWRGAKFDETCEQLDAYQARIRSVASKCPASNEDRREFLRVAKLVLDWGNINNLPRLTRIGNNALEELTHCARRLEPTTATMEGLNGFKYMGSGFSKIYSLMIDDFPIYDSRAACALTSLICLFCEDTGLSQVPDALRLGVPPPQGGRQNNPSRGPYVFPNIRGSRYALYAKSNVKAAWLLKELIVGEGVDQFAEVPEHRKVRALEAALFMTGHEPLTDDALVKTLSLPRHMNADGAVVSAAVQSGAFSAADKRELMAACRHEVPDRSGRRCAVCKECLHRDITIEGARATCRDCNKTFIRWKILYGWSATPPHFTSIKVMTAVARCPGERQVEFPLPPGIPSIEDPQAPGKLVTLQLARFLKIRSLRREVRDRPARELVDVRRPATSRIQQLVHTLRKPLGFLRQYRNRIPGFSPSLAVIF